MAKPFLLVGVAGDPDAGLGKGGLGEARAVVIGPQAAAPEVAVGPLSGRFSEGQHRIQPGLDRGAAPHLGWPGAGGPGLAQELGGIDPAGIAVLHKAHPQAAGSSGIGASDGELAPGSGFGGQAPAAGAAVAGQGRQEGPGRSPLEEFGGRRGAWRQDA